MMDADSFADEWYTCDEDDMWAEGWILDYADGYSGPSAIFATTVARRRDGDDPVCFASDEEARDFVVKSAAEGAPHARKALRIIAGELATPIPPTDKSSLTSR